MHAITLQAQDAANSMDASLTALVALGLLLLHLAAIIVPANKALQTA
jgi:hypothetical protein